MNICSICLHTERRMKLNTKLSEFHYELCGISLPVASSFYCYECEFLLLKFFKFKRRCIQASEIFQKWTSGEIKDQMDSLHTLLPPSLNVWKPGGNIANISLPPHPSDDAEVDNENSHSTTQELRENPYVEVKVEHDPTSNIESINTEEQNESIFHNVLEMGIEGKDDRKLSIQKLEVNYDCEDADFDGLERDETMVKKKLKIVEKRLEKLTKGDAALKREKYIDFDVTEKKHKAVAKLKNAEETDVDNELIEIDDLSGEDSKREKRKVPQKRRKLSKEEANPPKRRKVMNKRTEKRRRVTEKTDVEEEGSREERKLSKKEKETVSRKESSDRTKEALIQKLSSFGETRLDDDITMDEELVEKLLQHPAGKAVVRSLWKAECREDVIDLVTKIKEALVDKTKEKRKRTKPIQGVDRRVKKLGGVYEAIFDIEYLRTPTEKMEEFERRKTYEHYLKAENRCEICFQVFRGRLNLETHVKTYHDESIGDWSCPICKMRFPLKARIIRNHKQSHHAVYRCKLCPLLTYHRGRMKEHTAKHQGKTYCCEPCNVTYHCISAYYAHLAAYHRRGRIVCAHCGRGFPSEKSREVHAALAHKETPPIPEGAGVWCEECDVMLSSREVFEAHSHHVHQGTQSDNKTIEHIPGSRPWPKPVSGKQVPRVPTKQKCRVCNISRAGAGWLKAHFRWEHPELDMDLIYADKKLHLCDVCGIGMRCLNKLRDHMNAHTGTLPYACDICPKRFRSTANLKNHRLHHFPPSKPCPQCGKKFKTNSNLYNHMKGHSGERRYKCHLCEKGFLSSAALNEHVRGVHYNIRRVRGQRGKGEGCAGGRAGDRGRGDAGGKGRRPHSDQYDTDSSE